MINLAGVATCDETIRTELAAAGIDIVEGDRRRCGVPYSLTGRLGAFSFRRAWYYWMVSGLMPLEAAKRMAKTPCPAKTHYAWSLATDKGERNYRTLYGARMRAQRLGGQVKKSRRAIQLASLTANDVIRVRGYAGGADPEEMATWHDEAGNYLHMYQPGARAYVRSYHIDTQAGVNLFAETIRGLQ